jgi:hypothetical protein
VLFSFFLLSLSILSFNWSLLNRKANYFLFFEWLGENNYFLNVINPLAISDVWSLKALEMLSRYFVRAVENPDDEEARSNMMLGKIQSPTIIVATIIISISLMADFTAATYAGIGFGNAGVHLCVRSRLICIISPRTHVICPFNSTACRIQSAVWCVLISQKVIPKIILLFRTDVSTRDINILLVFILY